MSRSSLKSIQAASGTAGPTIDTGDEYFSNVVLLLDGDGTTGQHNNTFGDSSSSPLTITENGTVVQGSFSPYLTNWSTYCNGTASYSSFSHNTALNPGTGNFTIEFWIYHTALTGVQTPFEKGYTNAGGMLIQSESGTGRLRFHASGYEVLSEPSSVTVNTNTWYHIAVVRSGSNMTLYRNGVATSTGTNSSDLNNASTLSIGNDNSQSGSYPIYGYISNFRIVNGTAVYTSSFTPPTTALTAIANTALLTCQSNHHKDNSSNDFTPTIVGTGIMISSLSPFKETSSLDITTKGGSAFFDNDGTGNNNYLQSSEGFTLNRGNYTMEAWVYPTLGSSSYAAFFSTQGGTTNYAPNLAFGGSTSGAGYFKHYVNNTSDVITSSTTFPLYSWYHVAVVWDDTNKTLYVNGKSVGTHTGSYDNNTIARYRIGGWDTTSGSDFPGYVADARLIRGVVYKDEFEPPTSPISNTVGAAWSIENPGYMDEVHLDPNLASSSSGTVSQVEFSSDGTIATLGTSGTNGRLLKYNLSTAWDLSSWSSGGSLNLSSSVMTYPRAFTFGDSGRKVYAVNWANSITYGKIYQWNLSTAYDVTTGSYSGKTLGYTSRGNYAIGAAMSPDGDRFYFITTSNDKIHQYNLNTDYDISTASYSNKSLTIPSSVDSAPYGVTFKPDGLKMYVTGLANDRLYEYTLTTAWELDTATYSGVSYYWGGDASGFYQVFFKPDGTKFYFAEHGWGIHQYETINNSNILMQFKDSGIYDLAGVSNIQTRNQAQLDTSTKKYGTASIEFDGTADSLEIIPPPSNDTVFDFEQDFTIEFWTYINSTSSVQYWLETRRASGETTWAMALITNAPTFIWGGNAYAATALSNYTNTWIHMAFVRSGSTGQWYINGTASGSAHSLGTSTITSTAGILRVGETWNLASTSDFNGYIDDLRITKGIARYTSNFTPSSEALPKF